MTRDDLSALSYHGALARHFGSIDKALRRAGLEDWSPPSASRRSQQRR
jgi:hypothetical protein